MTVASNVWRDEQSSIGRRRAVATSVVALGLLAVGAAFLDARDDLYERMSRSYKLAQQLEQVPKASPRVILPG